ncbi:MAG: hypothetical protein ABI851_16680 [Saprospiraceae bacterium]
MEESKDDKSLTINSDYFDEIERAVDDNCASSMGFARSRLKNILNAFLENKIVVIEDLNISFSSIEEYKNWKSNREKLNIFNSDILINEIKLSKSRNEKW